MAAPPVKNRFVPFQLDGLSNQYDPETINRNFQKIRDAMGNLSSTFTETIRVISGDGGTSGLAGLTPLDLGQNILSSNAGTEEVLRQWLVDAGSVGDALKFGLFAQFTSASGTSFTRLRLGGSDWATDGSVVLSTPMTSATAIGLLVRSTGASPGGMQRLALTVQSPAANVQAQVFDGYAGIGAKVS